MDLKQRVEELKKLENTLRSVLNQDTNNLLESTKNIIQSLYRASPYVEGDMVILIQTPEISDRVNWGWRGAKHFLHKGAKATVKAVEWSYRLDMHVYGLEFLDETWIDPHTKEMVPANQKAIYYFATDWIDNSSVPLDEVEEVTNEQ